MACHQPAKSIRILSFHALEDWIRVAGDSLREESLNLDVRNRAGYET